MCTNNEHKLEPNSKSLVICQICVKAYQLHQQFNYQSSYNLKRGRGRSNGKSLVICQMFGKS